MAHRAVLACCSPYLFEIFNSDNEPHGVSHVTFEDLDPEAVEVLLNYAYTAQLVAPVDSDPLPLTSKNLFNSAFESIHSPLFLSCVCNAD